MNRRIFHLILGIYFSASILHELPETQQTMNNVKIEHTGYYCNSYAGPEPVSAVGTDRSSSVDAMVVSAAYCTYSFINIIFF